MTRPVWEVPQLADPVQTYQWGGFSVASRLGLHRLWPATGAPDIEFSWHEEPPTEVPEAGESWPVRWRDGSETQLSVGVADGTACYELSEVGIYVLRPDRRRIDFHPSGNPDPADVEHFLIHGVLAFYTALAGEVCLHTAALARDGCAVLVGGPSGAGKSYRSWTLINEGWDLLADDYSVLRRTEAGWIVHPQGQTLRLDVLDRPGTWDNRGKREGFVPAANEPARVESFVLLTPEPDGSTGSLLLRSVATIHGGWRWLDPATRADIIDRLARFMREVPVTCEPGAPG